MAKPFLCPACNTVTTPGAVEWGRTKGYRPRSDGVICSLCGNFPQAVSYDNYSKAAAHAAEEKKVYDQQVLICYKEGTKGSVKNISYKLIEHYSKNVLKEGKTDEKGLTERITTEKTEAVDVIVLRRNNAKELVEKTIGSFKTDTRKDSIEVVEMHRGSIFFDIRYVNPIKDPAQSFIKAAETLKKETHFDKYRGDVWWSFDVTTECDIKDKWRELFDLQQETGMEIEEGHILTHASKNEMDSGVPGLEFAKRLGCSDEDGTLSADEIKKLQKLKWSVSSKLFLYGCRTGLPVAKNDTQTMADYFFNIQSVKTIVAQKGYGYFSYNKDSYVAISSKADDASAIYLWAFNRGLNVSKLNSAVARYISVGLESGDGKAIPPYIRSRAL